MPRGDVFKRRGPDGPSPSISTAGVSERVQHLLEPGDHVLACEAVKVVQGKRSVRAAANVSVALSMRDLETGQLAKIRPLFVKGPNDANGPMAGQNIDILMELMAAIGFVKNSYPELNQARLDNLVGKQFEVRLAYSTGRDDAVFNVLDQVYGEYTEEPDGAGE